MAVAVWWPPYVVLTCIQPSRGIHMMTTTDGCIIQPPTTIQTQGGTANWVGYDKWCNMIVDSIM